MRKIMVVLAVIGLMCVWSSPLMAGGIINKSNLSSDYFRSLTRNAATDAADIVVYNPAGVMKLENGFYLKTDAMYINKDYSNTVSDVSPLFSGEDGEFDTDEPSIVPGIFAVYKEEKWAGFFAVSIPGGGGEVKYEDGSAYTSLLALGFASVVYTGLDSAYVEGNSYYVGYTIGGAYEINKKISVAGGVRYVDAQAEFKGEIDLTTATSFQDVYELELERSDTGWNYFLGLNLAPTDKLNIGFLYMSNTDLELESDVSKDTSDGAVLVSESITSQIGWADGTSLREDLPGYLALGISYQFTPKIRTELDYTLYLESAAELESDSGRFDGAGNSSDLAISIEYTFNPQWKASAGYMLTSIEGMDAEDLLPLAAELDASTWALGVVYNPNDRWRFNLGYTDVTYDSVTTDTTGRNSPADSTLEKRATSISAGVQYRFF